MKLLAVIPAYNEAPHVAAVVSAVQAQGVPLLLPASSPPRRR